MKVAKGGNGDWRAHPVATGADKARVKVQKPVCWSQLPIEEDRMFGQMHVLRVQRLVALVVACSEVQS